VAPVGKLVVYLHGAGAPATCGSPTHQQILAGMGFHTIGPCYVADYGVGNCGSDIGGCRGSHRLKSSLATTDGHSSTQAGGPSPQQGGDYVYLPVWTLMYGP